MEQDFKVVFTGINSRRQFADIAIDDVKLMSGENCTQLLSQVPPNPNTPALPTPSKGTQSQPQVKSLSQVISQAPVQSPVSVQSPGQPKAPVSKAAISPKPTTEQPSATSPSTKKAKNSSFRSELSIIIATLALALPLYFI